MSLSEKSSDRPFPVQFSTPSENTLMAAIAVCFLVLHVLAFIIMAPAPQSDAAAPSVPASLSGGD